jgi:3-carboxy-cis,cis-muconate cycloisomerase
MTAAHERTLIESLASTEALSGAFSDAAMLAAMLEFEVALARVEARLGVIPASAADAIAAAAVPGAFDAAAMASRARSSGTIAIPFVDALRARLRASDRVAATFVHWGATSQDVIDTAFVRCLVNAGAILETDHLRLVDALRRLSDQHATTVMLARTLMQPAPPTTFGLKAAGWLGAVRRSAAQLAASFEDACVLQFGGASGTLAALGAQGPAIATELGRELRMANPGAPWHAHRDRMASLVTACGVYTGMLGKIARDVTLLMQDEVAEAAEPGGASSSMPQKRNPAGCAIALAAAVRVPGLVAAFLSGLPQEHERAAGGWHAEMPTVTAAVQATGSALAAMVDAIEHLDVDADRMRANVAATRGTVFAERAMTLLAPIVGRDEAANLIASAVADTRLGRQSFADALAARARTVPALAHADLSDLDVPDAYLGAAEHFRRHLIENE